MPLYFNDEQIMLRDAVNTCVERHSPVQALRTLRDSGCTSGYSRDLWRALAEMGLTGIIVAPENGGAGLGLVEAGIVCRSIGSKAALSPYLTTAIGAVTVLSKHRHESASHWLERIVSGEAVVALGFDEGVKHQPQNVATRAVATRDGFSISGVKRCVIWGHCADLVIISARTEGADDSECGITLFALDAAELAFEGEPQQLVDSSYAVDVRFDRLEVSSNSVVGEVGKGWPILEEVFSALRCCASSELLGVADMAMSMMLSYLRDRRQFGAAIGSFQALQHRAARLQSELELAGAATLHAQQLYDNLGNDALIRASVAKSMATSSATLAVQEGIQMHGGIGVTDEHDIGFTMKRVRVLAEMYGDANFHNEQFARLSGY